jgi:DNA-binding MarR family transcriptional regulator
MDDAGLVTRGPHPSDGRRRLVRLTAAGAERLELIDPLVTSPEQRLLSSVLSGDEARGLRELLRRVREHMATLSVPGIRSQVGP